MRSVTTLEEATTPRRVFKAWSIEIPTTFAETFTPKDHYWHAYDEHRSVSLTSLVITDAGRPVPTASIVREALPPLRGTPMHELPVGLLGRAVTIDVAAPARASRALSGVLIAHGRLLLATITSDDLAWARRVWLSIRCREAALARDS